MNYCPFCQLPLDRPVTQCPSCNADLSDHQNAGGMAGGTLRESIADVREEIERTEKRTQKEPVPQAAPPTGTKKERSPAGRKSNPEVPIPRTQKQQTPARPVASVDGSKDSALPFRPVNRPPTLILCALDDGSRDEGEWHRVRKPEFRIGRTPGDADHPNDIVIANDNGVSSIHVEIKLRIEEGRYRYYLRDWPSRNGTFVRVSRAALKPNQELLIGARRYFLSGGEPTGNKPSADPANLSPSKATRGWEDLSGVDLSQFVPKLIEMTPRGNGREFSLIEGENLLGSDDSRCQVTITGDPFVSGTHARILKDKKQRWVIENLGSLNGIWLRIDEMALDTGGEFQIGEQRFLVKIP